MATDQCVWSRSTLSIAALPAFERPEIGGISQNAKIGFALLIGFVVYITIKGRLAAYFNLLFRSAGKPATAGQQIGTGTNPVTGGPLAPSLPATPTPGGNAPSNFPPSDASNSGGYGSVGNGSQQLTKLCNSSGNFIGYAYPGWEFASTVTGDHPC